MTVVTVLTVALAWFAFHEHRNGRVMAGMAAIVLRYYHGYSNREVAVALGVSERTVGQRISDALATLRSRLAES